MRGQSVATGCREAKLFWCREAMMLQCFPCDDTPKTAGPDGTAVVPTTPIAPPHTMASPGLPDGTVRSGPPRSTPPTKWNAVNVARFNQLGAAQPLQGPPQRGCQTIAQLDPVGMMRNPLVSSIHDFGVSGKGYCSSVGRHSRTDLIRHAQQTLLFH